MKLSALLLVLLIGITPWSWAAEKPGTKPPTAIAAGPTLGGIITSPTILIRGQSTLTADLTANNVVFVAGGTLTLGGHRLRCSKFSGKGSIELQGGYLDVDTSVIDGTIQGPGTMSVHGVLACTGFGDDLTVKEGAIQAKDRILGSIALRSPLSTLLPLFQNQTDDFYINATWNIPADAPADLGIGAFRTDNQGRWFQRIGRHPLAPGPGAEVFCLDGDAPLQPEGHQGRWSPALAAEIDQAGIFFWSAQTSSVRIGFDVRIVRPALPITDSSDDSPVLADLKTGPIAADGGVHVTTGQRWAMSVMPQPYPADPFDPEQFRLDLTVTAPDGSITTYAGFHELPIASQDGGNREIFTPAGPAHFSVRYRARMAGRHTMTLTGVWAGKPPVTCALPDLVATGEPWDDMVRVDAGDPRFFSVAGKFYWPLGCNFNSTYDVRSKSALKTVLTPDRGTYTHDALLERLADGGGNACETWLSPWNLGLEWIPKWPGYLGVGRYHQGHAWAFDHYLEQAERLGIRVNVTIFNHGMAREGPAAEQDWKYSPYNIANGGWLEHSDQFFTDERAIASHLKLYRYLAARFGDSPAILGWKLWAEVNLVNAPRESVETWHVKAAQGLRAADPWKHPITSHWSGDWKSVNPVIARQPTIDYLCIDVYYHDKKSLAALLVGSPKAGGNGTTFTKPVLPTEFGGSSQACPEYQLIADHESGPWMGLVCGLSGSPMLWWFEWIDQQNRFGIYRGLQRFLVGEDLRGQDACSITLVTDGSPCWNRAWVRKGRILAYLRNPAWGQEETPPQLIKNLELVIGAKVTGGAITIEWWNPDTGTVIKRESITHPDGQRLVLNAPDFDRHLALKLIRPANPAEPKNP